MVRFYTSYGRPFAVYRKWLAVCGTKSYHIWLAFCGIPHMASHIWYKVRPHMTIRLWYTAISIWLTVCGMKLYHMVSLLRYHERLTIYGIISYRIWLAVSGIPYTANYMRYIFVSHMVSHIRYTVYG